MSGTKRTLVLGFLAALAACTSDDTPGDSMGGSGGADAAPDDTAALPDLQNESSVEAGPFKMGIFAGSIGASTVKLVAFDLASGHVAGSATVDATFADAAPQEGVGRAFVLLRSDSKVLVLDEARPWTVTKTVDVGGPDAAMGTNPHAVVDTGAKAYVALYAKNALAVIDPAAGTVTGTIDLSQFADSSDPDGLVDVFDGRYDAATGRAYFLLQRTNQNELGASPDFVNTCLPATPLIVAIDAATDRVVDLNGALPGSGIELLGKNPGALVSELEGHKLFVVEAGCHDPAEAGAPVDASAEASYARHGRGIEAVDLALGTSAWLYEHAQAGRMDNLVWIDAAHAYVSIADAGFTPHWFAWDPRQPTLGAEEPAFPRYWPRHTGGGRVIGTIAKGTDAGAVRSLVSFDVGTKRSATIADDLYQSPGASEFCSWALVR
jgi:hypothetical protein